MKGPAAPISITVASGRGAQNGVLFKEADSIETLREIDTLVLDKTDTLTEGKRTLTELVSLNGLPRERLLAQAVALGNAKLMAESAVALSDEMSERAERLRGHSARTGEGNARRHPQACRHC